MATVNFKMASGAGYCRQKPSPELSASLLDVLGFPSPACLIGIPTMNKLGPKFPNWNKHLDRFVKMLPSHRTYYSAFVSRPDSAPWINNREYAELAADLWAGKDVAILCETGNSFLPLIRRTALHTTHVRCPHRQAFDHIEEYEDAIVELQPDICIMSCGPTATILANQLAYRGVHAVDFGSAGGFLRKLL